MESPSIFTLVTFVLFAITVVLLHRRGIKRDQHISRLYSILAEFQRAGKTQNEALDRLQDDIIRLHFSRLSNSRTWERTAGPDLSSDFNLKKQISSMLHVVNDRKTDGLRMKPPKLEKLPETPIPPFPKFEPLNLHEYSPIN